MIVDILTVLRKEFKEMLLIRGSIMGFVMGSALPMTLMGVFLLGIHGAEILHSTVSLMMWAWLPFFSVTLVVSETFAGERERHTLETLLATRLSDAAILVGKLVAVTLYGMALTGFAILGALGMIVISNHGEIAISDILIFFLKVLAGGGLMALLGACVGTPISLRSTTVRQANQTMSLAMMTPLVFLLVPLLPAPVKNTLARWISAVPPSSWGYVVAGILLGICLLLIGFAFLRFKRNLLILD
jgi:ABC-2 type transport system permease protein